MKEKIEENEDAEEEITLADLRKSYCDLQIAPLLAERSRNDGSSGVRFVPSSRPGDLSRPVANVKRFKKQVTSVRWNELSLSNLVSESASSESNCCRSAQLAGGRQQHQQQPRV